MQKFFMILLRFFRKPIELLGADYRQVAAIVGAKLMCDFRRVPEGSKAMKKKNNMLLQIVLYLVFGAVFAVFFLDDEAFRLGILINSSIILFILSGVLITDFTQVIFDPNDNLILLPRPVSNRTLMVSRLAHIFFYIFTIVSCLSLPSTIVILVRFGALAMLGYVVGVVGITFFSVFLSNVLYFFLSRVLSAERFKDFLNFLQIALSFLLVLGFVFLGKIPLWFSQVGAIGNDWWEFFVQPIWNLALVDILTGGSVTAGVVALAVLGIVVPILGIVFMVRRLTSDYDAVLEKLATTSCKQENVGKKGSKRHLIRSLACSSSTEVAGWKLAMLISGRDRAFKQMVYPIVAFAFAYIFIILKPEFSNFNAWVATTAKSQSYFGLIFMGVYVGMSIGMVRVSSNYHAAWIYKAAPIRKKGELLTGAVKAMIAKIFIPGYTLICLPGLYIWGVSVLPVLLLGGFSIVLAASLSLYMFGRDLPFSVDPQMEGKGQSFVNMLVMSLIALGLAGLIYLLSFFGEWVYWVATLLVALGVAIVFRQIQKKMFI